MTLAKTGYPAPFPMQLGTIEYGEEAAYRLLDDLAGEGVFASGDFAVTQKAAGANMSVDVATGDAYVTFDTPYGGKRRVHNDALSNSGTPGSPTAPDWATTFTAADGSNPRIDRVVLQVRDSALDGGGAYDAVFKVVAGTATVGATLTNLTGAGAVPANALLLANVLIPSGATTVTTANIDTVGDGFKRVRPRCFERDVACQISRAAAVSLATSGTEQTITLDTEDYDLDQMWAAGAATQIYGRTPGYYRINGFARFAANATGTRQVKVVREDTTAWWATCMGVATDEIYLPFAFGPILLGTASNTRYVELKCMQRSGGALNLTSITAWVALQKAA